MTNERAVAVVVFKDGRRLYGVWVPIHRCFSAQLYREQAEAEAQLNNGTYTLAEAERARPSAEDVVVRLLDSSDDDLPLLHTQASYEHAYIAGPYEIAA